MGINELEGWGEGAAIYNGNITTITNSTLSNNTSTRLRWRRKQPRFPDDPPQHPQR